MPNQSIEQNVPQESTASFWGFAKRLFGREQPKQDTARIITKEKFNKSYEQAKSVDPTITRRKWRGVLEKTGGEVQQGAVADFFHKKAEAFSSLIGYGDLKESIKGSLSRRGEKLEEIDVAQAGKEQTTTETLVQQGGQVIGAGWDVLVDAIFDAGKKFMTVKKEFLWEGLTFRVLDASLRELAETDIAKDWLVKLSEGIEVFEKWAEENPRAARNIEAAINIADVVPIEKGALIWLRLTKKVAQEAGWVAGEVVERVARRATDEVEKKLAVQQLDEAFDIVSPKLTQKQAEKMAEQGKLSVTKFLHGSTFVKEANKDLSEMAERVHKIVKKWAPIQENINLVSESVRDNDKALKELLDKWGQQLDELWDKVLQKELFSDDAIKDSMKDLKDRSRITFGKDKALESKYDEAIESFLKTWNKKNEAGKFVYERSPKGMMLARQAFDVDPKVKKILQVEDINTPSGAAVHDVRIGINKYIADMLPEEGAWAEIRGLLLDSHVKLKSMKNMSTKVSKPWVSALSSMLWSVVDTRQLILATLWSLGIQAYSWILTNPLLMGTLALGWTVYYAGKKISSSQFKKATIRLLKGIEKQAKTATAVEKLDMKKAVVEFKEYLKSTPLLIDNIDDIWVIED